MKIHLWYATLLVVVINLGLMTSSLNASDAKWDYSSEGSLHVSESTAGKAGRFRSYNLLTHDTPEKVVLWYAERMGFSEDHALVTAAKKGFATFKNPQHISVDVGHDTIKRKDYTVLVASISAQHTHIVFLHRPNFNGHEDVTISITTLSGGTHITVIRPIQDEFRKNERSRLKSK